MKRTEWSRQGEAGMVWIYRGFLLYEGKLRLFSESEDERIPDFTQMQDLS